MERRSNNNAAGSGGNRQDRLPLAEEIRYPADEGCKRMLREIQEIDFALTDTKLFLDAYPRDLSAMNYFNQLIERRNAAAAAYHAQCGPLIAEEMIENHAWLWINGPWPWQFDAN